MNLFIGPVAAGKSNIFKGLLFIQNSVHRSLVELFPPGLGQFDWVRSRWAKPTDSVGFELDVDTLPGFPEERARYSLQIGESADGLYVVEESLARQSSGAPWQWVFKRTGRGHSIDGFGAVDAYDATLLNRALRHDARLDYEVAGVRLAAEVARQLSHFAYFHLDVSRLKSWGTGQAWERIQHDGSRLPDFIAWTKFNEKNAHVYEEIRDELRQVLPDLDAIIVTQVESDRQGLAMSFKGHRGYIAARDLSDGTMFTLGLLCIAHQPRRPTVLCIEEPETGLHPRRLRWLFDHLVGLAYPDNGNRTQIFLSTHSPYLVDLFVDMQDSVFLVEQSNGRSRVSALSAIQEKLHMVPEEGEAIGHEWATGLFEGL